MNKKCLIFSLIILLSSIAVNIYLSLRSYSIKADTASVSSFCQIGPKLNCDTALTSAFSEIGGIPLSHFGLTLHILCLFLLLFMGWLERPLMWSRWLWRMLCVAALASVVMFGISWLVLKSFCPACILLYFLSFAILWPVKKILPSTKLIDFSFSKEVMKIPFLLAVIFSFVVFILHAVFLQMHPIQQMEKNSAFYFSDWKQTEPVSLGENRLLSQGPSQPLFTIVEFVDFLCRHCKKADQVLSRFRQTHPQVRIEWVGFPLNSKGCLKTSSSMSRNCYLVQAVLCSENQNLGYSMKNFIFNHQEKLAGSSLQKIEMQIQDHLQALGGQMDSFKNCIGSDQTIEQTSYFISQAKEIGVQATPSLFVNQKKLQPQAIQLTLQKIYQFYSKK